MSHIERYKLITTLRRSVTNVTRMSKMLLSYNLVAIVLVTYKLCYVGNSVVYCVKIVSRNAFCSTITCGINWARNICGIHWHGKCHTGLVIVGQCAHFDGVGTAKG